MKSIIFYIIIGVLILSIPIYLIGFLNTGVSQEYETNNPEDCVSLVSGKDLCQQIRIYKILVCSTIVVLITLMIFRKRILRKY